MTEKIKKLKTQNYRSQNHSKIISSFENENGMNFQKVNLPSVQNVIFTFIFIIFIYFLNCEIFKEK